MPEIDEDQLMWLEEDGDDEEQSHKQHSVKVVQLDMVGANSESEQSAAISALEEELQRTRKDLMDVRKELAAKTVQLSRKEVIVSQEKVAELAANVASEKDKQLASLAAHVEQLELVLSQKEEELEESRRLYNAQKRALREALAAAAEAEAAERQADEARARTAVAQVVEDELDRLQHELALLQARYNLEMRARDAELQALRSELHSATANRKQAVAAAEAALTEAWQAELTRATEEATARVIQLEAELARVRQQLEEYARNADTVSLAGELASLNQQKVAIQREFGAFREMATATSREHREAAARLLEENAALKSRLAARAFQDVQAGFKPQSKVFSSLASAHGGTSSVTSGPPDGSSMFGPWNGWMDQLPEVLARLERQRRGLVPVLALGAVVLLLLMIAVIRAAAVTRSEHSGGLCFLAHLGINVGPGCGPKHTQSVAEAAGEELGHLLDQAPRVHDVESIAAAAAATEAAVTAAATAVVERGARSSGAGSAKESETEGILSAVSAAVDAAASQGLEEAAAAELAAKAASNAAARAGGGGDIVSATERKEEAVDVRPQVHGSETAAAGGAVQGGVEPKATVAALEAALHEEEWGAVMEPVTRAARNARLRRLQRWGLDNKGKAEAIGSHLAAGRGSRRALQ